mmetsp:Transcript_12544/g.31839  ORF Transcript_12544/g.31839 Transcript_12544/m.31839 type:complete len:367 (+) Transcript_12544:60-1160(+)
MASSMGGSEGRGRGGAAARSPLVKGLRLLFLGSPSPQGRRPEGPNVTRLRAGGDGIVIRQPQREAEEEVDAEAQAPLLGSDHRKGKGHADYNTMDHFAGAETPGRESHKYVYAKEHKEIRRGWTRAAVLGLLDGLVSNLCLILGVMAPMLNGTETDTRVLLTGISGIFAGAFSMAIGEWLSTTAENNYLASEIEVEREHLEYFRREENEELKEWFISQGLRPETAQLVIQDLEMSQSSTEKMLNFHARFHWGIDDVELGGSPSLAAITSFFTFAFGAFVPLLPWLVPCSVLNKIIEQETGTCLKFKLAATLVLSMLVMFISGFYLNLSRTQPLSHTILGGMRHIIFGVIASSITFGIGLGFSSFLD